MIFLRKIQRKLYSLVTFIGCLLILASIMALVYEVTLEPEQPSVLRASWAKLRDNPVGTVQAMFADVSTFFENTTTELHTSSPEVPPPTVAAPPAPAAPRPITPKSPAQTNRPRERHPAASPRAAAPAVIPPSATAPAGPVFARELYGEGIRLINEDRRRHGISAVKVCPILTKLAEKKAKDFLTYNYFGHYSPRFGWPEEMAEGYFSPRPIYIMENISTGGFPRWEEVVHGLESALDRAHDGLMTSEGHRNNILASGHTHVGYALVYGRVKNFTEPAEGRLMDKYSFIVVQLFMREPRTDIHSIRMELVNTPVFVPGQPTIVTVRALAEYSDARPFLDHNVGIIIADEPYTDTRPVDRQFGTVRPGDIFTVTLQATPVAVTRFSHSIWLSGQGFSLDHAKRSEASLRFSPSSTESAVIVVTHTWRDAAGAERIDEWELPLP